MTVRRGKGEGSIYQRASDGRWAGIVDLGYVGGKRVRKTVYGKTQREVIAKRKALQASLDSGVVPDNATLEQWITHWLERIAAPRNGEAPPVKAAFLAERRRYRIFEAWRQGFFRVRGFSVKPCGPLTLELRDPTGDRLLLFAGRQMATAEGLELLALITDRELPDARPFSEAASLILETGGIPVIPWAPGKWSGRRGAILRRALPTLAPKGLMLCDSAIRPAFCPEPWLFHRARRLQVPVVAGGDPLPVPGEELLVGRYGSLIEADFDPDSAATAIPALLRERRFSRCRRIGHRSSFPAAVHRWIRHMFGPASD